MMHWLIVALTIAVLSHGPVLAAETSLCAPLPVFEPRWVNEHGEYPVVAYQDEEILKVLYVNPVTTAWTLVGVDPSGRACTLRSGAEFMVLPPLIEMIEQSKGKEA